MSEYNVTNKIETDGIHVMPTVLM